MIQASSHDEEQRPFLLGRSARVSASICLQRQSQLAISGRSAPVAINALMLNRTKLTGIRRQDAISYPVALDPAMAA